MPVPIHRIGAPTETRWMIHGSYVLDVLFGVSKAHDLDVGFDPGFRRPTESEIAQSLSDLSLPTPPRTFQFARCHDFSVPEAGGLPCFNIDFWQIHMDGMLYVAVPQSHSHHLLADSEPHDLRVVVPGNLTAARAVDGLEKMERYPVLRSDETVAQLRQMASSRT